MTQTTTMSQVAGMNDDQNILEGLYRAHFGDVVRRCQRILGNEADALDAAQEVFLRVMNKGDEFRHEAQWSTWLFRVATNYCLNQTRDTARRAELLRAEGLALELLGGPLAVGADVCCEANEAVAMLADTLDEKTVSMVLSHYVEEASQGEIALLHGLSRVTVNKKLGLFKGVVQRFFTAGIETEHDDAQAVAA